MNEMNYMSQFVIDNEELMIKSGLQYIDYKLKFDDSNGNYEESYYIPVPNDSWYYRCKDALYTSANELENRFRKILHIANFSFILCAYKNTTSIDTLPDEDTIHELFRVANIPDIHVYSKIRDEYFEFTNENFKRCIDAFKDYTEKKQIQLENYFKDRYIK